MVAVTLRRQDGRPLRGVQVGDDSQVPGSPQPARDVAPRHAVASDPCPRYQTPISQGDMTLFWD